MNTASGRSILFHRGASSLVEPGTPLGMTPPRQEKRQADPWQTAAQ